MSHLSSSCTIRAMLLVAFAMAAGLSATPTPADPQALDSDLAESAADTETPAETTSDSEAPDWQPVPLGREGHGGLLFVTDHPGLYAPAPRLDTTVSIRVTGLVTRVRVHQRFTNPHELWLEGIYVFPLPSGAAVDSLTMRIGERRIVGEIQERAAARKLYEAAKSSGKKASLVEQERPNLFTTSVANIGPGETIEVEIEYQDDLRWTSGRFELRFPMVANRRYIPGRTTTDRSEERRDGDPSGTYSNHGWATPTDRVPDADRITPPQVHVPGDRSFNRVSLDVDIDLGLPLARLTSPSHPLEIDRRATGSARVQPAGGPVPADRDFVLRLWPLQGSEPTTALLAEEVDGSTYYLLMLVPPAPTPDAGRVPRETIFVLDTSGSMSGTSIEQAKRALLDALQRIPPGDTFNIIDFDSEARRLFDHPVPAEAHNLGTAARWIDRLVAGGGTEMLAAFELALAEHVEAGSTDAPESPGRSLRQVIFITDGSVGNEAELLRHLDGRLGRSRIFPIAIGSAPNGYFLRRVAAIGGGTATFISATHEVSARMDEVFTKIEHPVLSDLEVFWDDTSIDSRPEHPGDLYLGEPLVLVARAGSTEPSVQIRGWLGDRPWERILETTAAALGDGLHKLWARREIAAHSDALALLPAGHDAEREALRQKIVDTGLAHHLVSQFTSLVAVDTTPTRPEAERLQSRPLPIRTPAGWTPPGGVLPSGGTASRIELVAGLALLLLTLVVWRRRSP